MAMTGYLGLAGAGLLIGSLALNAHQCSRLDEIKAASMAKDEAIAVLAKEPQWLDQVLTGLNRESLDIGEVRKAVRGEVRAAIRNDKAFQGWAAGHLPDRVRAAGLMLGRTGAGGHPDSAARVDDHGAVQSVLDRNDQR